MLKIVTHISLLCCQAKAKSQQKAQAKAHHWCIVLAITCFGLVAGRKSLCLFYKTKIVFQYLLIEKIVFQYLLADGFLLSVEDG